MFRSIDPITTSGFSSILYIYLISFYFVYLIIKQRKNKIVLFALGWFFVGVLPLYNMMFSRPVIGLIMQDNWIYFSSAGLFTALSIVLIWLKKYMSKKIWILFIVVFFLFCASKAIAGNRLWVDTKTYCQYWLKIDDRNYIAYGNLANYYVGNKDYERAKHCYKKAIDCLIIKKSNSTLFNKNLLSEAITSLGNVFYLQGNSEKAMERFKRAIEIDPDNAKANFNLGTMYLIKNNKDKAIFHYNEVIKREFYHFKAHYNLAIIYAQLGNDEEALKEKKIALYLDPYCFKE